jgi:hypothetical protein
MRCLFLAETIDINASSGAKGRIALIYAFKSLGYQLVVYHYSNKAISLDGIECHHIKEHKWSVLYLLSRVHRLSIRWFNFDFGKYIDSWLGFSFGFFSDRNSMVRVLKKVDLTNVSMVWTLSQGSSFRTHAAVLQLPQLHPKWYAYVHDPYPHHLYPRPYNYVEYGFKKKRLFFAEVMKQCHKAVFPSMMLKNWMQSYYNNIDGKFLIIPHLINKTQPQNVDVPTYFDPSKFNLLHAGNLLDLRDPQVLIIAFQQFLARVPEAKQDARLLFVGNISRYHEKITKAQQVYPEIVSSNGSENFNVTLAMQQHASVNIILEAKSEISPFLPGKFAHCVQADKPILLVGPYYSECKRLLGNDYPFTYDFEEVDRITKGIKYLYSLWQQDPDSLKLDRPDLTTYLSEDTLKVVLMRAL